MSLIRLLLGRRQFLAASLSSALMLVFGKVAGAFDLLFKTDLAKAAEMPGAGGRKLRGIVVYYSATGNTAQIARAVYRGMKSVISCDVVPITKMDPKKMGNYDVMAIGSPNWYMREVAVLRTFTHDMPLMRDKHCVIFGTHGGSPVGQFWSMSQNVIKKGMTIIGWSDWYGPDFLSPHHEIPHMAWGHPDNIDLAEAEAFGKLMAEYSIRIYAGETDLIPEIPTPDMGQNNLWSPLASSSGLLTFASPPPNSIPQFDLAKCVYPRCTQCIENCPAHAIDFSVMTSAGSIIARDKVVTQDEIFALPLTKEPSLPGSPLVLKEGCQHCGGMCQRVCKYDAIAYAGEKIQLIVNPKKCIYPKCTACIDNCPQTCMDFTKYPQVIVHNQCEAEGLCWGICPQNAIEVPNMAEIQLKKAYWFQGMGMPEMQPSTGAPGGGGTPGQGQMPGMGGGQMPPGMGGAAGQMPGMGGGMNEGPTPRFRSLVVEKDRENSPQVMFLTSYPRVPIVKKLWPINMNKG
jgi:ferredoxin/flavodoxin